MTLSLLEEQDPAEQHSPYRPAFVDCSSNSANIVRVIADVYSKTDLVATIEKEPILGTTNTFRIEYGDISKKYLHSEFEETTSFLETHDSSISASYIDVIIFEVTEVTFVLQGFSQKSGALSSSYLYSPFCRSANFIC